MRVKVHNDHIIAVLRALLLGISHVVLVPGYAVLDWWMFSLMDLSQNSRCFTLLSSLLLGKTESSLLFVYMDRKEMVSGP